MNTRVRLPLFAVFVGFALLFSSCGEKQKIRRTLRAFKNTEIVFPDQLLKCQDGKASLTGVPGGMKYIIYFPQEECSSCAINHFPKYRPLFAQGDTLGFSTMIIVSPPEESRNYIGHLLSTTKLGFPVWLDGDGRFCEMNPSIPSDRRFHCFLVDASGKPFLAGDLLRPSVRALLEKLLNGTAPLLIEED